MQAKTLFKESARCGVDLESFLTLYDSPTEISPKLFVEKTSNPEEDLENAVDAFFDIVNFNEKIITPILEGLQTSDIRLINLEFKFKSKESLLRKMRVNGFFNVLDIWDALRYTYIVPSHNFSKNVENILETFAENNIIMNKEWSNNYFCPGNSYKGFNGLFTFNGTQQMEVQIHTPESHAAKTIGHTKYEEIRALQKGDPRSCQLHSEMQDIFKDIPNIEVDTLSCMRISAPTCTLARGKNKKSKRTRKRR